MKITKYILVLLLAFGFGLCQAQTALAEKEEAKTETQARAVEIAQDAKDVKKDVAAVASQLPAQASKKELTPEEIEHLKIQTKIDQNAIESAQTVRKYLVRFMHWLDKVSPKTAAVMRAEYFGVKGIQYASAIVVLLLTFVIVKYVFGFVFKRLSSLSAKGKDADTNSFATSFFSQIHKPFDLFAAVMGVYFAAAFVLRSEAYIKISTRAVGIIFWCSIFWILIIISDAAFMAATRKLKNRASVSTANLMDFVRRLVKAAIIILATLSVLTNCGMNVNTLIASLGIGGMALAFASQDTIANFFGSVSIIIDRPFIAGDWVKTSSCEGTVEKIGFRSTRIRTFSKTIMSIPNSILAKDTIENFSKMPVRKASYSIGITYDATPEDIEALLPILRDRIAKIDGVSQRDGVAAEFINFGDSSLDIAITYYSKKTDKANYTATIRRVNLEIMRILREQKLSMAFPSTSVYIESQPK